MNRWADSFFEVPNIPIVDPTPQIPPDGFQESSIPPQIPIPAVIDATPITQSEFAPSNLLTDPSNTEASTSGQEYSEHQPPALRWTKSHPIDQVLGNPNSSVKTRRQYGNICLYVNFISKIKPKKIEDAMRDPAWVSAMQEELSEPRKRTIIGSKWTFRNKFDKIGTVVRNKAKLVAQGYRQEDGIEYDENFALVARLEAIRLFLTYAAHKNLKVFQMYIKNAFVDPALLRPDEMIMILNLYLVNRFQDQDQETNESVLQSTDPIH
ncbi:hypothetical protein OSB04_002232 [Centaurea solstitialis]|uniref:Reverse transcriptase Ty1/copia-type domain-containing protein n=1 Tax=Centaurea solstitialis TaxID=347529 RepID=A0AA38U540_9ASTR|nr:hypothetical protein OSB04_002232 [Centaurea solstitialis]